jgi:hypothetical protein
MSTKAPVAKTWLFASSSGGKQYQTLQYSDGSTSCDCMGWTRRTASDGSRSCKHVRMVALGNADSQAVKFTVLGAVTLTAPVKVLDRLKLMPQFGTSGRRIMQSQEQKHP